MVAGIILILAGILLVIYPPLLSIIVALFLILTGAMVPGSFSDKLPPLIGTRFVAVPVRRVQAAFTASHNYSWRWNKWR
jgi:hypothetical protein